VVKAFYQVSAQLKGIQLSAEEIAKFNKVLTAHIKLTSDSETRTVFADEIEREDLKNETRKREQCSLCICS